MERGPKPGSVDYFRQLGMTHEEAEYFSSSWNFQVPNIKEDGERAYREYLQAGSKAERERRNEMTNASDWFNSLYDKNPSET